MDKDNDIDKVKRKELIDLIDIDKCNHEMDSATVKYSRRLGREGRCRKCGNKIHFTKFYTDLKRERIKMKKKQRRKLNKSIKENKNEVY